MCTLTHGTLVTPGEGGNACSPMSRMGHLKYSSSAGGRGGIRTQAVRRSSALSPASRQGSSVPGRWNSMSEVMCPHPVSSRLRLGDSPGLQPCLLASLRPIPPLTQNQAARGSLVGGLAWSHWAHIGARSSPPASRASHWERATTGHGDQWPLGHLWPRSKDQRKNGDSPIWGARILTRPSCHHGA